MWKSDIYDIFIKCVYEHLNIFAGECKYITKIIRYVSIQHWCRKSLLQLARRIFVASPFHSFLTRFLIWNALREIAINYAKYGATASQFPTSFRKFLIAIPEILQTREIPRGRTLIASERFEKRDSFHSFKHSRFLANPIKFFDLWRFFLVPSQWIRSALLSCGLAVVEIIRYFLRSAIFQRRTVIREHFVESGLRRPRSSQTRKKRLTNCLPSCYLNSARKAFR